MVRRSERIRKKSKIDDDDIEEKYSETAASKFMSIVTDDLLLEILLRLYHLPTLIQCKTVCKRWFSLITTRFVCTFFHHKNKKLSDNHFGPVNSASSPVSLPYTILFRYYYNRNEPLYELFSKKSKALHGGHELPSSSSSTTGNITYLNFLPWNGVTIQASFEDLLLVSPATAWKEYCICNPLTRQWIMLPRPPLIRLFASSHGLVCEPNRGKLGCTDNNIAPYTYKVVLMVKEQERFHAVVFCSKSGKWSTSTLFSNPSHLVGGSLHESFVSNRIIYWILKRDLYEIRDIVTLDPFNSDITDPKRSRVIHLPVGFVGGRQSYRDRVSYGLVQGRLRLSQLIKVVGDNSFVLKVWELNCDKDGVFTSWLLMHNVSFKRPKTDKIAVIAFHPNDGDVVFMVRNHNIYKYEIEEDKYEKVGRFPDRFLGRKFSSTRKQTFTDHLKVFTLVHPALPILIPSVPTT
ncbi:F-box domain containing protein [Trema orientale]|uniref:F-box domain containing protein n=1 Tax=Trema orientale TaxID=63057 RepID=A0A2P5EYU8_TREOI|nr:F-box domain containing protein [Trema orientale]